MCRNKGQIDLLETFSAFIKSACKPSKLILIGATRDANYREELVSRIKSLGLSNSVDLIGTVNNDRLYAYYRAADAYVSMSEHEGFGVPLIEAMAFDVPVLAHACGNVPHTVGAGGLLFADKRPEQYVGVLRMLAHQQGIQDAILDRQRRHIGQFRFAGLRARLAAYLRDLGIALPKTDSTIQTA
jgi:glycosyltransferase involved in cell wall biosynthesis